MIRRKILFLFSFFPVIAGLECSSYDTLANLSRLEFKIGSTEDIELAGVPLKGKKSIRDFTPMETLRLSTAFVRDSFSLTMVINVDAKNQNDGTGDYARSNITIVSFPWRLLIDDKETVTGNIGPGVVISGTGKSTEIPLIVNVDLVQFFKDRGYEGMLKLALNITGLRTTSPSKIILYAQPTVGTQFGEIKYPDEIEIVNLEHST